MADVLIVSRTQMGNGNVCVGGYDTTANCNVRLLVANGGNQPSAAPFQVGEIWGMTYVPQVNPTAPHVEDVLVQSATRLNVLNNGALLSYITGNCPVVVGGLNVLFGGCVNAPQGHAAYIDSTSVPNHSVCFWRPSVDLHHVNAFNKDKYHYVDQTNNTYFAYVGIVPPINVIPAGSIVRMSLARWWTPPGATSRHCYLQLSGWY